MASGGIRENAGRKPKAKKTRVFAMHIDESLYKKLRKKHGKALGAFIRSLLEKE